MRREEYARTRRGQREREIEERELMRLAGDAAKCGDRWRDKWRDRWTSNKNWRLEKLKKKAEC